MSRSRKPRGGSGSFLDEAELHTDTFQAWLFAHCNDMPLELIHGFASGDDIESFWWFPVTPTAPPSDPGDVPTMTLYEGLTLSGGPAIRAAQGFLDLFASLHPLARFLADASRHDDLASWAEGGLELAEQRAWKIWWTPILKHHWPVIRSDMKELWPRVPSESPALARSLVRAFLTERTELNESEAITLMSGAFLESIRKRSLVLVPHEDNRFQDPRRFWAWFGKTLAYAIGRIVDVEVRHHLRIQPRLVGDEEQEQEDPLEKIPGEPTKHDPMLNLLDNPRFELWRSRMAAFVDQCEKWNSWWGDHMAALRACIRDQLASEHPGEDPLRERLLDLRTFTYLEIGVIGIPLDSEVRKAANQLKDGLSPCLLRRCCGTESGVTRNTLYTHTSRLRKAWLTFTSPIREGGAN